MVGVSTELPTTRLGWPRFASAIRAQLGVAGAQWLAGLGNLAFALTLARVLAPGDFASFGAFLGAYVLLHLPAAGLGAGAALAPGDDRALRSRLLVAGTLVGSVLVVTAPWTAAAFAVPVSLVVILGAAAPGAAPGHELRPGSRS